VNYRDFRDMRWFVRAIDGLSRFFGGIAAVLVITLVVLMLYDVVLRYALNAPTTWGNDMNTWLMGASFVLSIAYAMSTDSHVRVDLLYDERTRPRMRYFDLIGLTFVILPTVTWITWGLLAHFQEAYRTGERSGSGGWNPIVWPFKLILLVGFLILTMQIVAEIIKRAASLMGRPVVAESPPADLSDHGV
jgi:TRAP-type mannitol/chloroaromatic compound transport system permease small subunit